MEIYIFVISSFSRNQENVGKDVIFDDSLQDQIVEIAPDVDLVKQFIVKTPFDKKCGVHSSLAHSECNTDKKVNRDRCNIEKLRMNGSLGVLCTLKDPIHLAPSCI